MGEQYSPVGAELETEPIEATKHATTRTARNARNSGLMILPTLVRMSGGLSAKNSTAAKKHRRKLKYNWRSRRQQNYSDRVRIQLRF